MNCPPPPPFTHPSTHTYSHTHPHCFSGSFILLLWHSLPPLSLHHFSLSLSPLLSAHHRSLTSFPLLLSANRWSERCGFTAGGWRWRERERRGEESAGEKSRFPELLGETTPGLTLSDVRGAERLSRPGIKTRNKKTPKTHTNPQGGGGCSVCGYLRVSAPAAGALQSL